MFGTFFGNYLLNEHLITPLQMSKVLVRMDQVRVKIGTMAIHAGYMTADQVEEVHKLQSTVDKRFGEIAIENGYLTTRRLESLLKKQKSDLTLLAEALIEEKIMNHKSFEAYYKSYKEKYDLSKVGSEDLTSFGAKNLMQTVMDTENEIDGHLYTEYVTLSLKNIQRFLASQFVVEGLGRVDKKAYDHLIYQRLKGENHIFTAVAGETQALSGMASNYAEEIFEGVEAMVVDALGEFMNLNNGLFIVNQSNMGVEMDLEIQSYVEAPTLNPYRNLYSLSMRTSKGAFDLVFGLL